MSEPGADNPSGRSAARRGRRLWRWGGFAVAIGLLATSVYYAAQDGNFAPLLAADPLWVGALVVAVLISTVGINGLIFYLVNKPYVDPRRPVSPWAMFGLVAASGLLNYTPVKAGMFGRVAYLKHRHGVSYRASVLIHLMIAGALISALAICGSVTIWRGTFDPVWIAATAAALVGCSLVGALIVRRMLPKRHAIDAEPVDVHSFSWTAAHLALWIVLAMGTIFMTAVRWWIACHIMNLSITPKRAVLMAVLHTFSNILPANGLGQREWLMGLLFGGEAPADLVAISLVDRAAEAGVLIVVGIISLAWLHRADPTALHGDEVESEFADE